MFQDRHAGVVLEADVFERDFTVDHVDRLARRVLLILGRHLHQLTNTIEAGEGFADLRPDRCDLHDWRRHQAREEDVGDELAERHAAVQDGAAADQDHRHANHADDHGRERRDGRHAGDRPRDVAVQPVHPFGEHQLLALLRRVGLDDADAAEGFVQPTRDFCVDLAALAEQRPKPVERQRHPAAERGQERQRDEREPPVQVEQVRERRDGGDDAAGELDEPGADEVSNAFRVGHDPRDQHARLRRIEVPDRQSRDVRLDAAPHVGDGALRRNAEHLREGVGRDRLDDGGSAGREGQRRKQVGAVLPDDIVDQRLGGPGQDEAREAIHEHQPQAERQPAAARPDQRPRFLPRVREVDLLLLRGLVARRGAKRLSGSTGALAPASRSVASHRHHLK